ncbi:hypothetical protein IRJ41_013015 [Triplophysa rosa]|uniref:Uncharacterized protein n=1 Tax=Triplophysa rosa TaxID=992332 RepID=A0A9W7WKM9_TRIRA|nr:hypothetical protein IRJ41_013015 [Triplophysa rosa]
MAAWSKILSRKTSRRFLEQQRSGSECGDDLLAGNDLAENGLEQFQNALTR